MLGPGNLRGAHRSLSRVRKASAVKPFQGPARALWKYLAQAASRGASNDGTWQPSHSLQMTSKWVSARSKPLRASAKPPARFCRLRLRGWPGQTNVAAAPRHEETSGFRAAARAGEISAKHGTLGARARAHGAVCRVLGVQCQRYWRSGCRARRLTVDDRWRVAYQVAKGT